jgi:PBSX family phage terminase large subunit
MKIQFPPFKWGAISRKQEKIFSWWMPGSPAEDCDAIIADGAIRGGKTLPMSLSFPAWAMEKFENQNFIMGGKTIGSFRRNVLNLQKRLLEGEGYHVEEKRSEKLLIVARGGRVNNFYIFGGKDEASQDLVQGLTAAGALLDEVALMPESFVDQVVARCSVENSKLWFNCNPEGPFHYFKKKWIDQARAKNAVHLHFTMDDNLTLSDRIKERYRKMFSGVAYRRFIEGLWVLAQGIIYDMFDESKHIVKVLPAGLVTYYAVIDYGTVAPCIFLLFAFIAGKLYLIDEYCWDSQLTGRQKTNPEYSEDFRRFIKDREPSEIFIDPSASSFILQLRKDGVSGVRKANNTVLDGIRTVASALNQNFLNFLHGMCPRTFMEFGSYVWDEKAQEQGEDKPIKKNDHCMDGIRYLIYTKYRHIINNLRVT